MRDEQNRHAENARVLAEMNANLTSIPSELRAVAEAVAEAQQSRNNIEARNYMQEAAAHLGRQAQDNHTASMQVLRNNISDLACSAMQMGDH